MLSIHRLALIVAPIVLAGTPAWSEGEGAAPGIDPRVRYELAQAEAAPAEAAPEAAPAESAEPLEVEAAPAAEVEPAVEVESAEPVSGAEPEGVSESEDVADILEHPLFQEPVTLDFRNADIQNVIRLIAHKTGLNVLMDPNEVKGTVTLHLEDVPLGAALDNILKNNKLAYIVERGNIVRIVPESRVGRELVETRTEIIYLNWRNAADIEDTFKTFLTGNGSIKANEESQAVIITDVPPNIVKIKQLISDIDKADRQVLIECRLVDIQIGALRAFGTQYSLAEVNSDAAGSPALGVIGQDVGTVTSIVDGVPITTSGIVSTISEPGRANDTIGQIAGGTVGGVVPVLLEGFGFAGGQGTLQFGTEVGIFGHQYDVNATMTALENRGIVEVLANPRVTTLNNVEASIEIIQRVPYTTALAGAGGTVVVTIKWEDTGEFIKVKPIITPSGHVRLDTSLNQIIFRGREGSKSSSDAIFGGLAPPNLDERNTKSTVIVENEGTAVLGGLRRRQSNSATTGVPFLHRVPVFGWLFKNKNSTQDRIELVLMITPHILEQTTLNQTEKNLYDKIDVNWTLPDYFLDASPDPDDLNNRDENHQIR